MREWRWPILIVLLALPVVLLLAGYRIPGFEPAAPVAKPMAVPGGDREIAWIHTTTNATTWERFVAGVVRVQLVVPEVRVDDTMAFLDSTTAVPELVLSHTRHAGKLRIRWYKLQNEVSAQDWVEALSRRDPAPLAVIGGGSTDRAIDLARALAAQDRLIGERPPLLITTATADEGDDGSGTIVRLVDLYERRTFRFCFTNGHMAEAVLDFALSHPDVRPLDEDGHADRLTMLSVFWEDDRYSSDLQERFSEAFVGKVPDPSKRNFSALWKIPFSVGGLETPNSYELQYAQNIAQHLEALQERRVLLVIPAITQPAKRLLKSILQERPGVAAKLAVVTGDGIPINAILRDGEFAWPVRSMPVPLVLFAHSDPTAWDRIGTEAPIGYRFSKPTSTEEAMHFGELARVLLGMCWTDSGTVRDGKDLTERLNARSEFFDGRGERRFNTGEHVVVVLPKRDGPELSVWRRAMNKPWTVITTIRIGSGGAFGVPP